MSRPVKITAMIALLVFVALGGITALTALADAPAPTSPALAGIVIDTEGKPVEGALVRVYLTVYTTTTAADGSFTLTNLAITQPVSVTAWAAGYYVGFTTALPSLEPVTITMKPHYTTDNVDYPWFSFGGETGSASCGLCHTANPEWEADAHSQAAVNPRFLTLYEGSDVHGNLGQLTQRDVSGKVVPPAADQADYGPGFRLDYPNRAGNCASCHTPAAAKLSNTTNCGWSGCHTNATSAHSPQVPDGVSPLHLTGDAAEGIGCDFCHKIGEVYLDPKNDLPYPDMPGILSMRLFRPNEDDQLFFGPYDDVPRRDTYLPLQEESAFCAPCHYGVFGGIVGDKKVAGGTVIYNSYGEWLDSPYSDPQTGQTCQQCHMPPVENKNYVFPEQGGKERDYKPVHNHLMPGAKDENLLQNSVTMTTTATLKGQEVTVKVSITNDKTGHHVPTDVPLRHMILVIKATDANGKLLRLSSGPVLPDWTGNYAGQPGRYYAKILEDTWTGEIPTAAYWRDVRLVEDTRLAAFATDVSRYAFTAPAQGQVKIEATLVFRRAFQKLMEQKGWNDPDIVMENETVMVNVR